MNKIVRLFFICLLAGFSSLSALAQDSASSLVHWEFSSSNKGGSEYLLTIRGRIAAGWRLFSTTMKEDLPNTRIVLDSSTTAKITGIEEKGNLQVRKEPVLDGAVIRYFENQVEFLVTLDVVKPRKDIKGLVNFMAMLKDSVVGPEPIAFRFYFDASGNLKTGIGGLQESVSGSQMLKRTAIDVHHPINTCGGTGAEDGPSKGLWGVFILGFLGGLIALLTPCVFPMIPLTVSFFTKKSAGKRKAIFNALTYGFFIFLIYILLSLPFYFLDSVNPEILNNISTNVWLNVIFFVVFVIFALSFFGLFEITLPSGLANAIGSKSGIGGLAGIFFMALTLALVSFSCTGPILGSLLAGSLSSNGGAIQLSFGMAGFGFALALPFALFAMFPGWLNSLPRSGSWLNSVKIVLGFLEIALAVKFLSNADLVEHWGILKREIFLGIWILTGIPLVLYLFGILRFKHDPPPKKIGIFRIAIGIFFLAFTGYLVPGITKTKYANLGLISGFPPPLSYSLYGNDLIKLCGVEPNLRNDYQSALLMAKEQGKPLMIDFTGWACVNCRRMEENVWTDPQVKKLIQNNFILVSLFVDDRKSLPDKDQFIFKTSDGSKKPIVTIGDEFATLQSENFINASQPLYVLINPEEKLLTYPVGNTPNPKEYAAWLRCGLDAFHKSIN